MKKETLIIVILAICLIGVSGFIVYNQFNKKDSTTNDDQIQISSNIENRVSNLSNIEKFLEHIEWSERNVNILANSNNRLEYITYLLNEGEDYTVPEEDEQTSIKTSFTKFQTKYKEIYGTLYSLDNDLNNESNHLLVDYCDESKNEICWNFANISGINVKLTLKDKVLTGNIYTLTGSYEITGYSDEELEENNNKDSEEKGNFEIKYLIDSEKEQLQSIILKK